MNSETLIKILPLIGIVIGLFIGDANRTNFIIADVPLTELIDGFFNRTGMDQQLAKRELTHIGTYGLIGGLIGFVLSVVLKNQTSGGNK